MQNYLCKSFPKHWCQNGISIWHPMVSPLKEVDYTISFMFILTTQPMIIVCVVEPEVWQSFRCQMQVSSPCFLVDILRLKLGEKRKIFIYTTCIIK